MPRGFYLWGIALSLYAPFAEALTIYLMHREGLWSGIGPGGITSYAASSAVNFVLAALCYTALSALGMWARRLSGRLTRP